MSHRHGQPKNVTGTSLARSLAPPLSRDACAKRRRQFQRLRAGWVHNPAAVITKTAAAGCYALLWSKWLVILGLSKGGWRGSVPHVPVQEILLHLPRSGDGICGHRSKLSPRRRARIANKISAPCERHACGSTIENLVCRRFLRLCRDRVVPAAADGPMLFLIPAPHIMAAVCDPSTHKAVSTFQSPTP
jgi:hypothetical protein